MQYDGISLTFKVGKDEIKAVERASEKCRGINDSRTFRDKWELPEAYLVQEVDLRAGQGR